MQQETHPAVGVPGGGEDLIAYKAQSLLRPLAGASSSGGGHTHGLVIGQHDLQLLALWTCTPPLLCSPACVEAPVLST
jgi:hypothetical protein